MRNDFLMEGSALLDDYLSKTWAENHKKASADIAGLIGRLFRIAKVGFGIGGDRTVDAHPADCRSSSVAEAAEGLQTGATRSEDADSPITIGD